MKKTVFKTLAATSVILATGCASIVNDDIQQINVITSNGEEFKGTIDGIPFEGPGIVNVTRANHNKIIVSNTPNCTKQTMLTKSVDPMFFGNFIFGGLFGSSTDYSTEKMWKYDDTVLIGCK